MRAEPGKVSVPRTFYQVETLGKN